MASLNVVDQLPYLGTANVHAFGYGLKRIALRVQRANGVDLLVGEVETVHASLLSYTSPTL
jgi:hypothetical protein